MPDGPQVSDGLLRLSLERRIDAVCMSFEEAWQKGSRPRVEPYLVDFREAEYSALLRELLALELVYRRQNGDQPTWEEYALRFPEHVDLIRAVWSAPAAADAADSTALPLPSASPGSSENECRVLTDMAAAAFPGYEVLGLLGHGSMGVVYKARQRTPNRLVALKVIRAGSRSKPEALTRLRVEAEAVARLQHPNIVQVYQVGEQAGLPFLALEFVEGGDLTQQLTGGPQPARTAVTLIMALAGAMHAVHGRGIVHRDLKPANVLLTKDGVPKIADFGLAKLLDQDDGQTQTGVVLGTPTYMAPEQADGRSREVKPAADIYALGAILYELLTGRPPFHSETVRETLEQVRTREPERPRALNPRLDAEFEAVCLKCLEKEPGRRYESAKALADDLERWLKRRPTKARPRGRLARIQRALCRHAFASTLTALLMLTSLTVAVLAYVRSPVREQEAIERELIAGRTVSLQKETGWPRLCQVRTDANSLGLMPAPDGAFSVSTFGLALVEVLPRVPVSAYRFSAEVHHDRGREDHSRAGIYFAHHLERTGPDKCVHCFLSLEFHDVSDFKRLYSHYGVTGNPAELTLQRCAEPGGGPRSADALLYRSFPFRTEDWRRIDVEVMPDRVRAFWEGNLMGELTIAAIRRSTELQLQILKVPSPPADPEVHARGGLGLLVLKGNAWFRRVEIKPLVLSP